jgi:hypothetical protein
MILRYCGMGDVDEEDYFWPDDTKLRVITSIINYSLRDGHRWLLLRAAPSHILLTATCAYVLLMTLTALRGGFQLCWKVEGVEYHGALTDEWLCKQLIS